LFESNLVPKLDEKYELEPAENIAKKIIEII